MKNNKALLTMTLCLMAAVLTACGALVAGGAGAGAAYTYYQGWLDRDYDVPMEEAWDASLQAVRENDMQLVEQDRQVASGEIRAKKGEESYWIKMEQKSPERTQVSVRAGLLGDEAASRKIQNDIDNALGS